jgi:hypothetical protein
MQHYDGLNAAIAEIMREGTASFECVVAFSRAADGARFLFGKDVGAFIINLRKAELAGRSEDDEKRAKGADWRPNTS